MSLAIAAVVLVLAILIGAPAGAAAAIVLVYLVGASGGRPPRRDAAVSASVLLIAFGCIIAAAIHLGTRL